MKAAVDPRKMHIRFGHVAWDKVSRVTAGWVGLKQGWHQQLFDGRSDMHEEC
jgi:hypothetical protein